MVRLRLWEWCTLIFSLVCLLISIFNWSILPSIYFNQVKKHLEFRQNKDYSYGYSTFMLSHPPINNVMRFFFFNVTNPDEMIYEGAKPMLKETGGYAVVESEEKKYLRWSDDGTELFYQSYKMYVFNAEHSCSTCGFDDLVTIPNPVGIGAAIDIYNPQYGIKPTGQKIISIFLLLVGEYPFVTHSVREILFDGYNDPLLSISHSQLIYVLSGILNGGDNIIPIPIPPMLKMGFFQGYNNTRDEEYLVNTGKNDINRLGEIKSWANRTSLPENWWSTTSARSINGSDSGSFCKMNLQKTDKLPFFQSFMCRSFTKTFLEETVVHSIPSYSYAVPYEDYDTTADHNIGFRYKNVEKVNYYPNWPSCPDRDPTACMSPQSVDCSLQKNFCNNCCNGSYVGGTYLIPPGIFPLVCYPGHLKPTPFSVMYSPPHFLYSPPEVIDSVFGLNPNPSIHKPMIYNHEPYSGSVTEVFYRLQVSMPVTGKFGVVQNHHLPNSIIPIFWENSHTVLHDDTYNLMWTGFVFVPKLINFIKFFLAALALFLLALMALCILRRKSTNKWESSLEIDG